MRIFIQTTSLFLVFFLTFLLGCGTDQQTSKSAPQLFFLSASPTTPAAIVLSFSTPMAPLGMEAPPSEMTPKIEPAAEGRWRWRDETRLAFEASDPFKSFVPGRVYRIDFSKTILRTGDTIKKVQELTLPVLQLDLFECSFENFTAAPPIRRQFRGRIASNYPVPIDSLKKLVSITSKDGAAYEIIYGSPQTGVVQFFGPQLPLPAIDSIIEARLSPGQVRIYSNDGPIASFSTKGLCSSPVKRSDWLALERGVKPIASALQLSWGDAPSEAPFLKPLRLQIMADGREVTTRGPDKTNVAEGVSLIPPHKGTWSYDSEASLIFTPQDPIPPGTTFEVRLSSFPGVEFQKPVSASLRLDPPSASVESLELYHDPARPRSKRVAATVSLSYPFEPGSLESLVDLRIDGVSRSFDVVYDPKDRSRAYIKSSEFELPASPAIAKLRVNRGIKGAAGGSGTDLAIEQELSIPSQMDVFKIEEASANEVTREDGTVERILALTSSIAVEDSADLASHLDVLLLPACSGDRDTRPSLCREKEISEWSDPGEVDSRVEKVSQRLSVQWKSSDEPQRRTHFFSFEAPEKREILVRVRAGARARGEYLLKRDARFVVNLGRLRRELHIMHDGALLSLSGNKKLGLMTLGVNDIRVGLKRVTPENFKQFAALTAGKFKQPDTFLGLEYLAEEFSYEESFPQTAELEKRYTAVDFSKFLNPTGPPRGLFILTVRSKAELSPPPDISKLDEREGRVVMERYTNSLKHVELCSGGSTTWDPDSLRQEEGEEQGETNNQVAIPPICDQRLVLITDLGLLVKRSETSEQDIFVMSFRTGEPVSQARVSLLGKNGVALFTQLSNNEGHVHFPRVDTLVNEKQPVTYIVEKDGDLSFLPYERGDRQLNLSRFDTGGVQNLQEFNSLQAYVFTDRGIYRPGDTVHLGMLVRKKGWEKLPAGLPLEISIIDSRGKEVFKTPLSFDETGFTELSWQSNAGGTTGTYRGELHLVGGSKRDRLSQLGGTSFRIEEFQPDRLLVKTEIISSRGTAIIDQRDARARVVVRNLFGTEAVGNTTAVEISVRPWSGTLPQYPGFQFKRTIRDDLPTAAEKLGEQVTAQDGSSIFQLGLEKYNEPSFEFTVAGEGFEKGSGRSVLSVASTVATSLSHLIGFKPNGDLDFIHKGSERAVELIAVDNSAQLVAAEGLAIETIELTYQSTLVRQPNGLYAYQSVERETLRNTAPLVIQKSGDTLKLKTSDPGRFRVKIRNGSAAELLSFDYTVTGQGNVTKSLERDAELTLTLDRGEYEPGAELAVNIVAPYTGAGILTIESDRVHTQRWFKTSTTSTTEKIKLPDDLIGNAYLSVAFVRSFDSPEIFMSPLSYGVAPFKVSTSRWTSDIRVETAPEVMPGTDLDVSLTLPEAGKAVVFAVDEGILQFARYRNPQPLGHFFRKRALQVSTYQILDLILPDYQMVQKISASGGDEDTGAGRYKNPFARKQKPPMAFWSGVAELSGGTHHIKIPIPTYFNGTVRVIAVAAHPNRIGTAARSVIAKGPFVIQPQQPYAVAPGDEFEVGAVIGNNTSETDLSVALKAPEGLAVISDNPLKLSLASGQDTAVRFRLKSAGKLGPVSLGYSVTGGGKSFSDSEEVSVRPAQPFMVLNTQGQLSVDDQRDGKVANFSSARDLFTEFRSVQVSISGTPFGLLSGVVRYLREYPYGCTEQIVSQAFPALILGSNEELGFSQEDTKRFIDKALRILTQRQRDDGSFGLWSLQSASDPFFSVYATHFLVTARFSGQPISQRLYDEALRYLREYTNEIGRDWSDLRAQSYALYVLSLAGEVVTDKIKRLEAVVSSRWRDNTIETGWVKLFLATAYRLNNLDSEAGRLFGDFLSAWRVHKTIPTQLLNDSALMGAFLYLTHNHFSDAIQESSFKTYLFELSQEMLKRKTNSLTGSFALLGLGSFWKEFSHSSIGKFTVSAGTTTQPPSELALKGSAIKRADVPWDGSRFTLKGDASLQLYYQVSEAGYDRGSATSEIKEGISLSRRLLNGKGEAASAIAISDSLTYEITLNPSKALQDLAVVVIVPGGFEIDLTDAGLGQRKSLPTKGTAWEPSHVDVMEDRVVLFGNIGAEARSFAFKLKPVTKGLYQVPPLFAEGMYDREILYRGVSATVEVKE